jgi:hypothetical protein
MIDGADQTHSLVAGHTAGGDGVRGGSSDHRKLINGKLVHVPGFRSRVRALAVLGGCEQMEHQP